MGFLALESGIWDRVLKEGNMQNGIAGVLVNFQGNGAKEKKIW